eukprot:c10115_g1_i1.p1 GENE.c10115_g1_i1~~c10115_g1_i1.p1  ORF type:complete len:464 (-),score=140.73 c10115_g1_i1:40-1431(-)
MGEPSRFLVRATQMFNLILLFTLSQGAALFSHNTNHTIILEKTDDSASSTISFSFAYFGRVHHKLYIGNNGLISFDFPVVTFTAQSFPLNESLSLIAPFWADVDTRPELDDGNHVMYEIMNGTNSILEDVNKVIRASFRPKYATFSGTRGLMATWYKVGAYFAHTDQLNTFQTVLVTNEVSSFVMFIYPPNGINWIFSDSNGLPQAGFNCGDGENFYLLPDSNTVDVYSVMSGSNIGIAGVWLFQVDEGSVNDGSASRTPSISVSISVSSSITVSSTSTPSITASTTPTESPTVTVTATTSITTSRSPSPSITTSVSFSASKPYIVIQNDNGNNDTGLVAGAATGAAVAAVSAAAAVIIFFKKRNRRMEIAKSRKSITLVANPLFIRMSQLSQQQTMNREDALVDAVQEPFPQRSSTVTVETRASQNQDDVTSGEEGSIENSADEMENLESSRVPTADDEIED